MSKLQTHRLLVGIRNEWVKKFMHVMNKGIRVFDIVQRFTLQFHDSEG